MKVEKEMSAQAKEDSSLVLILQNEETSSRDKERAFNSIYAKHEKQVLFFFKKRVKCVETAEDLRIITFQKVFENIGQFDREIGAFSTWVYKIAKNLFIDNARKQNFEVVSIDAMSELSLENGFSEAFQIKSNTQNPEQVLITEQETVRISKAINSLKKDSLKILANKRFIDGKSFEEITKELGLVDNSSLRVKIKRIKETLKKSLQE